MKRPKPKPKRPPHKDVHLMRNELTLYDAMPAAVRKCIASQPYMMSMAWVWETLQEFGADGTIRLIRAASADQKFIAESAAKPLRSQSVASLADLYVREQEAKRRGGNGRS